MKTLSIRKIFCLFVVLSSFLFYFPVAGQENSKRRTCEPVSEIDLGVREVRLEPGESYTFRIRYEPEDPCYYTLHWFVSNESVISVDQGKNEVTALAPGSARILAESLDGMAYTTCEVIVNGTVGKEAAAMKSGSSLVTISDADRAKITARSVKRNLEFIEKTAFSASSYESAGNRNFFVTAHVRPGTEEAESRRALDLGMSKAEPLTELNLVNLRGTIGQILAFTSDNPDLLEVFELEDSPLEDPVITDPEDDSQDSSIGKSISNLGGCAEDLTSIDTAHTLGLKGSGTTIAVIDTGINSAHEQYEGRVVMQHCFSTASQTIETGTDRWESSCQGGENEATSAYPEANIMSYYDHGAHVAGIAAGKDGVAPKAKIVAVLAFTDKIWWCTQTDIDNGYFWRNELRDGVNKKMCLDNLIQYQDKLSAYNWLLTAQRSLQGLGQPSIVAVNMSYGGGKNSSTCDYDGTTYGYSEKNAYDKLIDIGIMPVNTTGNNDYDGFIGSPGCKSNAFRVGALNNQTTPRIANYSNHSELVDILAPGTNIKSSYLTPNNKYGYKSGTSMAAPMVTGAVAILKEAFPKLSVEQLQHRLKDMSTKTADTRANGSTFSYTKPVLDLSGFKDPASVIIRNSAGTDVTNKTKFVTVKGNQLKAEVLPEYAPQPVTWVSSDTTVATVTANGYVYFSKTGTVTITAKTVYGTQRSAWTKLTYVPKVESIRIFNSSDVDVTEKNLTLYTTGYKLKATVSPSQALSAVTWTSSNSSVAWVSTDGNVTFEKSGTVKIYAKATDDSDVRAWVQLTYIPLPTSVRILNASGSNITGKSVTVSSAACQLSAAAEPPETVQKFAWASSDSAIATVDSNGLVSFKKPGTVTITAVSNLKNEVSAWTKLTYRPLATAVTIHISSGTDITGKTVTVTSAACHLKAVAAPSGALQKFTWKSSDTGIAAVDSTGKVTFKKSGTVTVTATAADGSGKSAWVKIKLVPVIKIQTAAGTDITGKTLTVNSASHQLKAVITPSIAAQTVTWKSSDTGTATVNSNGKVTFKKSGQVTITATAADGSGKSAWVKLNFAPKAVNLEIKDSNIRGKNREIQVVVPWNNNLSKIECTLFDDSTGKQVNMSFKQRMDANGKNKIISYVGDPLVNGKVYRFRIRVWNGVWSNTVEKYAMPIPNVYGATVVAGNKTMVINTKHREPADGTRYMIYDAGTNTEIAHKVGTKNNTSWTYSSLTNGKLYYALAVSYRDYKGQRLWGPNENRIYFIPMSVPANGSVSFSSATKAVVSIANDTSANGIRVLYRTVGGALVNGCEGSGNKCTVSNLNRNTAYEFYVMKYKTANSKKYYSMGILIPYKTGASGLTAPQSNPTVAMNNSGYTTFTIKKSSNAVGISVLYRIGEGAFKAACEKEGNSCSVTLDITKNYTFYIMQYKLVSGKKVYSPGIVARDFTSGKSIGMERLYTKFDPADDSITMAEIAEALGLYYSEDELLMVEAGAVMGLGIGVDEYLDLVDGPAMKTVDVLPETEDPDSGFPELYRLEERNNNGPVPGFVGK